MGIIGSIRKHSWIAVTIVGIAIIAFIIGDLAKRSGGKDTDMAEVNGETLKRSQFEKMFEQEANYNKMVKAYIYEQDPTLTSEEERALRDSIWANYLDEMVVGEQLEKLGLEVTDAELNDMLTGTFIHPLFAYDPNLCDSAGNYIRARMSSQMKALEGEGVDPFYRERWERTKELVKKDRLREKYVTLITSGFYMPKPIANQMASYTGRGVNVSVVRMPYDQVANAEPSDADYQKYYNKHKEEYRNFNEESRVLEYVAFDIVPSDADFKAAVDSAKVIWDKLESNSDTMSRALDVMVRKYSKDITKYSYDSTYNRYLPASYFTAPFSDVLAESEAGSKIAPMPVNNNKWIFMARVMGVEERPDSIRTSVIFMLSNDQHDSTRTAFLSDSVLTELNAGRLDFDTAIAKYSDFPTFRLTRESEFGDMDWQKEGYLDHFYNSILKSIFRSLGYRGVRDLTWFNGINEEIAKTPKGGQTRFALPDNAGYVIVKVTDQSAMVKKYNLAMIVQKVKPSTETVNNIQKEAYDFLSACHNGKDYEKAAQKYNRQFIQVYRTDNRKALSQPFEQDGVVVVRYLNNLGDIVKWAFNENTKVGDVNIDIKLDRGLEPYNGGMKNGSKENSVDMIGVVRLSEVYQKGYLTLAQLKTDQSFKQLVSLEKKKEMQMANAQKIAQGCKTIEEVADKLNDTVTVVENVSLSYVSNGIGLDLKRESFGNFETGSSMPNIEGKVQAVAVASKGNGLIGPIQGSNGVYFVQVNGSYEVPQADPEQIRLGRENMSRYMYGTNEGMLTYGNNGMYADWNVVKYMPRVMIFTGDENRPYYPLYRDCRLTQWLRANAKVEDHREQIY